MPSLRVPHDVHFTNGGHSRLANLHRFDRATSNQPQRHPPAAGQAEESIEDDPVSVIEFPAHPSPQQPVQQVGQRAVQQAVRTSSSRQHLQTAVEFWYQQATAMNDVANHEPSQADEESPFAQFENREGLTTFLQRLRSTAEFQNQAARPALVVRVVNLLQTMLINPLFRERAMECIEQAIVSCDDRVIMMLNQVELQLRIIEAEESADPEFALQQLAVGLIKLNKVHQCAAEHCQITPGVDEVEVFLAYETLLADQLDLPISTRHMLFERIAGLSETQLQFAAAEAHSIVQEPGVLDHFLGEWDPWQRHVRAQDAEGVQWSHLMSTYQSLEQEEGWCPFTLEPVASLRQPVRTLDNPAPMEFQPFLEWWVANGVDPITKRPIQLGQVVRIEQDGKPSAKSDSESDSGKMSVEGGESPIFVQSDQTVIARLDMPSAMMTEQNEEADGSSDSSSLDLTRIIARHKYKRVFR